MSHQKMLENMHLEKHIHLLKTGTEHQDQHELSGTPVFTREILEHSPKQFSQYGFWGGMTPCAEVKTGKDWKGKTSKDDPRLFFNISAPSSAFICGSQGSGKSHTLSCLLENCLMVSEVSELDSPLAGLVFHYDSFISDKKGAPCEAAYLASNRDIEVRILCAPTNLTTIRDTYAGMNVTVEALSIDQSDLSTKRMLDLMAVNQDEGQMPLYLHSVNRILRELRIKQQENGGSFDYAEFKQLAIDSNMTPHQLAPLTQRLDTLESFIPKSQIGAASKNSITGRKYEKKWKQGGLQARKGSNWDIKSGSLTIVDLSCPCMTAQSACALFNMCLSLFLEQNTKVGRIVALDEAHKYMNSSSEASSLTETLLSSIRLQRHLGVRVFISTQEPTISPRLLDLCSITIVHRFTSPDWLRCLRSHLASLGNANSESCERINDVFDKIVQLRTGEALMFAPSAIMGVRDLEGGKFELWKLGVEYLHVQIRARLTVDGGKSVLAMGTSSNGPKED